MDLIEPNTKLPGTRRARLCCASVVVLCLTLAACADPEPRSFAEFMEDQIAREGTLARCDAMPQEARNDIECANARRAEATFALRLERERLDELERESQRKIEELTQRMAERERLAQEAARQAVQEELEAYEARWLERLRAGGNGPFDAQAVDRAAAGPLVTAEDSIAVEESPDATGAVTAPDLAQAGAN
jgi:hypothetical protein